jgi:hypothetical protein
MLHAVFSVRRLSCKPAHFGGHCPDVDQRPWRKNAWGEVKRAQFPHFHDSEDSNDRCRVHPMQVNVTGNNSTTCRNTATVTSGEALVICDNSTGPVKELARNGVLQPGGLARDQDGQQLHSKKVAAVVASIVVVLGIAGLALAGWWRQHRHPSATAFVSYDDSYQNVELAARRNSPMHVPES